MTLEERQLALLADLIRERAESGRVWERYYDRKIAEMQEAIHGGGAGVETGRNTSVQDVSSGDAQAL